jgi:DNA-3-methyladenine glycosylase
VERLPREFYARPTLTVARELVGQCLVRMLDGQRLAGRIVEVEAYLDETDQASHARPGHTRRNAPMYGPPGHAYVYFIYGMYHCLNAVTEPEGSPAAVLIRALEPLEGLKIMRRHRPGRSDCDLTDGPGKLCQALAVDRTLNYADLCHSHELWIEAGASVADEQITTSSRIGVRGDQRAQTVPWRFYIHGHPCLSRRR